MTATATIAAALVAAAALTVPTGPARATEPQAPAVSNSDARSDGGGQAAQRGTSTRRVLLVGPTRRLRAPSHAARLARNGDVVRIDAGVYRDCAIWRAHNLTLTGVGGYAHVKDVTCENKAIWVIKGDNTRVQRIEFSNATATYKNGAGIRQEGRNLVVRNSYFHDNENGILTGPNLRSSIFIVTSIFERNGKCEPDCAHGVYIGRIGRLVITGSTFRHQRIGHHIKSRAIQTEIIGNRIEDGRLGTASMSIDLPNGGTAIVRQNYLQQGPRSDNHGVMVSMGEEGLRNPTARLIFQHNVFRNDHRKATAFVRNRTPQPVVMQGNQFFGKGRKLEGPGLAPP